MTERMSRSANNTNICTITYNETDNIREIIDEITEHAQKKLLDTELLLLIVDDNSPDGTQERVTTHPAYKQWVHLHTRDTKEGLGAAYIDGMKTATQRFAPDALLEMDADHSHDPKDIIRLIQAPERIHDVASTVCSGRKHPR